VLAAEYSEPGLRQVHRLSVDAYAVQHSGDGSRQAVQSVGLHLARLHALLERRLEPEAADAFMLRAAARKSLLRPLQAPAHFAVTVADILPLSGTRCHAEAVRDWARSAWDAWAHEHDFVRSVADDG
jgi:hypothetical protein